jgi:hypothetical protein
VETKITLTTLAPMHRTRWPDDGAETLSIPCLVWALRELGYRS